MGGSSKVYSRSVQELMMEKGEVEIPDNYLHKNAHNSLSLPLVHIPVIDLGLLAIASQEELHKLCSALTTWGCFQAINHGMTDSFLDNVREVTKQFFALPMEEKQSYSREADELEGYGNDMVLSDSQILDWTDRLYLVISPEDQRKLKYWPHNPQTFRGIMNEYTTKLESITEKLLKAMARSLNFKNENCFLNQYGERAVMSARFSLYPPCPRPDSVLGLKPHADGSVITLLLPDQEVEGLQFFKDDQWIRFPVIPHALLINAGDLLEVMSNGVFKSPVHRVVANAERERISLTVFCMPRLDKEVEPVDELITAERPRMYNKVKDYLAVLFDYYQRGLRPIDAFKM